MSAGPVRLDDSSSERYPENLRPFEIYPLFFFFLYKKTQQTHTKPPLPHTKQLHNRENRGTPRSNFPLNKLETNIP